MLPNLPGNMVIAAMRELPGITPWQETLQAMNLIGSHDTHRIISLLGDPGLENKRNLFHARARSEALQWGGLRCLSIADDAFTFLWEAPGRAPLSTPGR